MSVKGPVIQTLNLKSGNLGLNLNFTIHCVKLRTLGLWALATVLVEKWSRERITFSFAFN